MTYEDSSYNKTIVDMHEQEHKFFPCPLQAMTHNIQCSSNEQSPIPTGRDRYFSNLLVASGTQ